MNIAMIPARMGSQRLKQKNLRTLAGLPLITHAIRKCKAAHVFDEIWVNSEHERFGEIATDLLHDFVSRLGRGKDASPRVNHVTGDRLGDGGHRRRRRRPLGACRGNDADLARPRISEQFAAAEIAVNTARDEVGKSRRGAAIRRVRHLDSGHLHKQKFGQMRPAPGARRRDDELSRLSFHIVDKLRDRRGRRRIRHEHENGNRATSETGFKSVSGS